MFAALTVGPKSDCKKYMIGLRVVEDHLIFPRSEKTATILMYAMTTGNIPMVEIAQHVEKFMRLGSIAQAGGWRPHNERKKRMDELRIELACCEKVLLEEIAMPEMK